MRRLAVLAVVLAATDAGAEPIDLRTACESRPCLSVVDASVAYGRRILLARSADDYAALAAFYLGRAASLAQTHLRALASTPGILEPYLMCRQRAMAGARGQVDRDFLRCLAKSRPSGRTLLVAHRVFLDAFAGIQAARECFRAHGRDVCARSQQVTEAAFRRLVSVEREGFPSMGPGIRRRLGLFGGGSAE